MMFHFMNPSREILFMFFPCRWFKAEGQTQFSPTRLSKKKGSYIFQVT